MANDGRRVSRDFRPTTSPTRWSPCGGRYGNCRQEPGLRGFAGGRHARAGTFPSWKISGDRWKVHPIADWTDRDVGRYLGKHDLPYHPLWAKGYVSIGDRHSTRPIHEVAHLDETRFHGLKRECGLHEIDLSAI